MSDPSEVLIHSNQSSLKGYFCFNPSLSSANLRKRHKFSESLYKLGIYEHIAKKLVKTTLFLCKAGLFALSVSLSFAYAQIGSQDLGAEEMTASVFVEEGKILFVGSSGKQIALLKVLENGVPDSMFGVEGKVRLSLNSDDFGDFDVLNITSSVKQGDNILVSGYTRKDPSYKTVAFIARLTPTGAFDTDFNESGIRIIKFPALQGHLDGDDDDRLLVLHFSEFETKGNLTDQMIFIHLIQAQYSYSTTLVLQFL